MPITNIQSSNTIDQFRLAFNDAANAINSLSSGGFGGGALVAGSLSANNLTSGRVAIVGASGLIQDDSALTYNTTTDILTLSGTTDSTSSATGTLVVSGGLGIAKAAYVGSNVYVTGVHVVSNTVDSTYTGDGSLIIGGGVGIAKRLFVGSNVSVAGIQTITNTTDSLATSNGALVVSGGVGIAKNINVAGIQTITNTTDSLATSNGALVVSGGVGVAKNVKVGGSISGANITLSDTSIGITLPTVSSIVFGATSPSVIYADSTQIQFQPGNAGNAVTVKTSGTDSSSTTTGALIVTGGIGVSKNVSIGGIQTITDATNSSNSITGALVVSGGVGIGKNLYVSGNTVITGNLTVLGSNTEISTTQINVNDPLIQLANNNTSDLIDIGLFGQYNSGAGNVHSGIFRDSTDGIWKLFKSYSTEPTTKITESANNFAYADLNVNTLTANSYVYLNNQNVLRFGSANANYVGFKSNSAVGANVTWTLPAADGTANLPIITNGSGVLSFGQVSVSTGISGLGANVAAFLATPTANNLANTVTDETGTGSLVFANTPTLVNPTITNYTETRYAATITGNAITLSLANGTFQTITTMVGANAITLPAPSSGKSLTVQIAYASTPTTMTFATPSGLLKYPGGTTPTPTLTNAKFDFYSFVSDGTNWYGVQTGANF